MKWESCRAGELCGSRAGELCGSRAGELCGCYVAGCGTLRKRVLLVCIGTTLAFLVCPSPPHWHWKNIFKNYFIHERDPSVAVQETAERWAVMFELYLKFNWIFLVENALLLPYVYLNSLSLSPMCFVELLCNTDFTMDFVDSNIITENSFDQFKSWLLSCPGWVIRKGERCGLVHTIITRQKRSGNGTMFQVRFVLFVASMWCTTNLNVFLLWCP